MTLSHTQADTPQLPGLKPVNLSLPPHLPFIALLILLPVLSCWPVWGWLLERAQDGTDDPFNILALPAAGALIFARSNNIALHPQIDNAQFLLIGAFLTAFSLSGEALPMIVRSGLALTALALIISPIFFRQRLSVSLWGLLMLSLPVVASLQFYLGFPLRMLITHATAASLNAVGYPLSQSGTELIWNSNVIGIDPACSGIKMLWSGYFAAFALGMLYRLHNSAMMLLACATFIIILLGNIARANALVMMEILKPSLQIELPVWIHSGVGILAFILALGLIAFSARNLSEKLKTLAPCILKKQSTTTVQKNETWRMLTLMALICVSTVIPSIYKFQTHKTQAANFSYKVPAYFDGMKLHKLELSREERQFAQDFPGYIYKLTDGNKQVIYRIVNRPTRLLHPAEDCFRGSGYRTKAQAKFYDGSHFWGEFLASKGDIQLRVQERIFDQAGNSWADASSWYWAAALGRSRGPWHALTIASPYNLQTKSSMALTHR